MLGIIGLIIGIAILIILAFRGWNAVVVTLIASIVVCLFNGVGLWTGLTTWTSGLGSTMTSYILLFFMSAIFANVMEATGSCNAIANKFIDWFGTKHILTVMVVLELIICYGGVNFFVSMYVLAPIMFKIFKELNVPRKLAIIPFAIGGGCLSYAMPGSTQLSNVIPTALGTSLMAAPVMGFVSIGIGLVVSCMLAEIIFKREMAKVNAGQAVGWTGDTASSVGADRDLPDALCAFIPMVFLIVFIIGFSIADVFESSTALACLAMLIAFAICLILNIGKLQGNKLPAIKKVCADSATNAVTSLLPLAAIVGFGTIVSSTAAFTNIIDWVMNVDISVYWKGTIATALLAGVTGSASSGVQLTVNYLGDFFISSGANLGILHRLMSLASITFDSLPHSSGVFIMFAYLGLNHKDSYKYVFLFCTVISLVIVLACTLIASIAM